MTFSSLLSPFFLAIGRQMANLTDERPTQRSSRAEVIMCEPQIAIIQLGGLSGLRVKSINRAQYLSICISDCICLGLSESVSGVRPELATCPLFPQLSNLAKGTWVGKSFVFIFMFAVI